MSCRPRGPIARALPYRRSPCHRYRPVDVRAVSRTGRLGSTLHVSLYSLQHNSSVPVHSQIILGVLCGYIFISIGCVVTDASGILGSSLDNTWMPPAPTYPPQIGEESTVPQHFVLRTGGVWAAELRQVCFPVGPLSSQTQLSLQQETHHSHLLPISMWVRDLV